MTKISIILCVYNGEKFIENAIKSVLNQTLEEIELIIVNDGSTDNTPNIIKQFNDERIKIINQENKGLGASRNIGMEYATGEYIGFLDADDWLDEKMCEITYTEAKKNSTDITMFQIINYDGKTGEYYESDWFNLKNIEHIKENQIFTHNDTKDVLFDFSLISCQKIYINSFLKKINAKFPENIYFEDMPFFYYVYLKAKKISIIRKHLYYRLKHEDSITERLDHKFLDTVKAGKILFDIFTENNFYEDYKYYLIAYKINGPRMTLAGIDKKYQNQMYNLIKEDYENIKKSEYYNDFLQNLGPKKKKFFEDILNTNSYDEFMKINKNKY